MKRSILLAVAVLFIAISATFAQVTLPYYENFENAGNPASYTQSDSSINGVNHWAYDVSGDGRLRWQAGGMQGNLNATLDSRNFNTTGTNYLTLTLDLSSYQHKNLQLAFQTVSHMASGSSDAEDRVMIRGHRNAKWIEIQDWTRQLRGYRYFHFTRIDSVLAANNQKLGKSFQLRFGCKSASQVINNGLFDGLSIDSVHIGVVYDNNAALEGLERICAGSSDVKTQLKNHGADTLKSAKIAWWIDGKLIIPTMARLHLAKVLPSTWVNTHLPRTNRFLSKLIRLK